MPTEQEVRIYGRSDGSEPFTEWLRGLHDGASRNRIRQRIARLRLGNFGDARSVGDGVHELRIHFGPGVTGLFRPRGESRSDPALRWRQELAGTRHRPRRGVLARLQESIP